MKWSELHFALKKVYKNYDSVKQKQQILQKQQHTKTIDK